MIIASPIHTFKTHDTFFAAQVDGDTVVLAESRNEEAASEGNYARLLTVIPLQEAIAMAKAILASQQQAQEDAWIEELYQRHLDRIALVDDALEHDVQF